MMESPPVSVDLCWFYTPKMKPRWGKREEFFIYALASSACANPLRAERFGGEMWARRISGSIPREGYG